MPATPRGLSGGLVLCGWLGALVPALRLPPGTAVEQRSDAMSIEVVTGGISAVLVAESRSAAAIVLGDRGLGGFLAC